MVENKDNLVFKDLDIFEYVESVFKSAVNSCRTSKFNPISFNFQDLELFSRIVAAAKTRTNQLNILINNIKYRKIKSLAIIKEIKDLDLFERQLRQDTKAELKEKILKITNNIQELEDIIKKDGIS